MRSTCLGCLRDMARTWPWQLVRPQLKQLTKGSINCKYAQQRDRHWWVLTSWLRRNEQKRNVPRLRSNLYCFHWIFTLCGAFGPWGHGQPIPSVPRTQHHQRMLPFWARSRSEYGFACFFYCLKLRLSDFNPFSSFHFIFTVIFKHERINVLFLSSILGGFNL